MLNPFRSGFYAVQLFSHKVMRYAVPIFLVTILATSVVLARGSVFYSIVLVCQIVGYLAALGGWALEASGVRYRLLALPHYFVLANLASILGFYHFLRGQRYAYWEPTRDATLMRGTEITAGTLPGEVRNADARQGYSFAIGKKTPGPIK
jgi:hypothetical protein